MVFPHGFDALFEHVVVGPDLQIAGPLDVVVSAPKVLHGAEDW